VRVLPDIDRAGDALPCPVLADGLRDGENVLLGERAIEGRAAVAAGSEADALIRIVHIGTFRIVVAFEAAQIDEQFGRRGFSSKRAYLHAREL
jgi:hypothetical protein